MGNTAQWAVCPVSKSVLVLWCIQIYPLAVMEIMSVQNRLKRLMQPQLFSTASPPFATEYGTDLGARICPHHGEDVSSLLDATPPPQ